MILPVTEAKMNWCPFARTPEGNRVVDDTFDRFGNFPAHPAAGCRCIASDCMMWRKVSQVGIGPNGEKRDRDMDGRTLWVDTGYCGLAGKPESHQPKAAPSGRRG